MRRTVGKSRSAVVACLDIQDRPCEVCGTDGARPMVFRGEQFCCDNHRKVIIGEIAPTTAEWGTMSESLREALKYRWGGDDAIRTIAEGKERLAEFDREDR